MPNRIPATPYAVPRWTSVLATASAVLVIVALLTRAITGADVAWADALPWVVVLALAIPALVLVRVRATPFAMAAATVLAFIAGPQLITGALGFTFSARTPAEDWVADVAQPAAIAWNALDVVAGLLAVLAVIVIIVRVGSATAGRIPRTPFRVEVIGALVLLGCAAVVQLAGSSVDMPWLTVVVWVSRFVPLLLLLALALRVPGAASLAIVGALLLSIVMDVVVNASPIGQGPEVIVLLGAALVLAIIVIWWNATPQPTRRTERPWDTSAPLEPWAGVALVLSFVPLFFIAAVVLGHLAYERIEGRDSRYRGRVIAASAIVFSFTNLAAIVLVVTGSLSALSTLAEGL